MSIKDSDPLAREVVRAQIHGVKEGRSDTEIENEIDDAIARAYKRLGEDIPYEYTDEGRQDKLKNLEAKSKKKKENYMFNASVFALIPLVIGQISAKYDCDITWKIAVEAFALWVVYTIVYVLCTRIYQAYYSEDKNSAWTLIKVTLWIAFAAYGIMQLIL